MSPYEPVIIPGDEDQAYDPDSQYFAEFFDDFLNILRHLNDHFVAQELLVRLG